MPTENSTESNTQAPAAPQQGSPVVNANSNPGGIADQVAASGQPGSGPAQAPPGPAPAQTRSSEPGPNFGEVLTTLQAMPEQIVRALKEAAPAPQRTRNASAGTETGDPGTGSQTGAQTGSEGNSSTQRQKPGPRSFGTWWFGR